MNQYIVEYCHKGSNAIYSVSYVDIVAAINCWKKMIESGKYSEVHISGYVF